MSIEEIGISVSVNDRLPFRVSALERMVLALGGPQAAARLCNRLAAGTILAALVGLALATLQLVTGHWTPLRAIWLNSALTFFLAFQLVVGGLRFACMTLQVKRAEHFAQVSEQQFHERVGEAVMAALDAHFRERAAPPPTIN